MTRNHKGRRRAVWIAGATLILGLIATGGRSAADEPTMSQTLISLDADSTSLTSVLQILAARSGLNIVTSPDVQGKRISIHLRDTPFDEALNLIVRTAGLGYERVGRSILVAGAEDLASPTGLVTRVFDLQYANAEDVRSMLEVLTKDVKSDVTGHRVAIRATESAMEQAENMIGALDQKPEQVLLQARLVEVSTSALLELGIDWEKIAKWTTIVTEGNHGPSKNDQIPEDIPFTKVDTSNDYYRQMEAFEVSLDALITEGKAHLLSNSSVVTLDGVPAQIFSGETVPVIISSLVSPGQTGGAVQTVTLEKIDVGVKLDITPRISKEGFITAFVNPEISQIERFVGPNSDLPQTSTRRARTFVRVHEGEKIFIGGLLSEESRRTVKKVPLLGSIPLIGHLFRHYRDDKTKLDLVIEITPRIVGDQGAALPAGHTGEGGEGKD